MSALIRIRGLEVAYPGSAAVLGGVDLDLAAGEMLGVVGESGAGKTTLTLAIAGLLPQPARVQATALSLAGTELVTLDTSKRRRLLGREIGVVFQDAGDALNPVRRVGRQLQRVRRRVGGGDIEAALQQAGIEAPGTIAERFPHELSGGQRQRVQLAAALLGRPRLLLADEPASSLDPVRSRALLETLTRLCRERGLGVLLVTHDLAGGYAHCDRLAVIHRGRLVETATTDDLVHRPSHRYTRALFAACPRLEHAQSETTGAGPPATHTDRPPLLSARAIGKRLGSGRHSHLAVRAVDLDIRVSDALGIAGVSGSGKTTLANLLVGLARPDSGRVLLDGEDFWSLDERRRRRQGRRLQLVFQQAGQSLSPRRTVAQNIQEAFAASESRDRDRHAGRRELQRLMDLLELSQGLAGRYPAELSGGQQQRVAIARALATGPAVLIADEPTSTLDVSVQARVIELLLRVRREANVALVVVSHELAVLAQLCRQIAIMDAGAIVERGACETVLRQPRSAQARRLLQATVELPGAQSIPDQRGRPT